MIDTWATANILVPAMIANGYSSYPKQDPFNPGSAFRIYFDNTMRELLAAGVPVTNDLANVIVHVCELVQRGPDDGDRGDVRAGAYPNPFAVATTIRFSPRVSGIVRLDVFDVTGRSRRSIERTVRAGITEQILWDGRDDDDRPMPSGTYYYRLRGAGLPASGKAALAR